MMKKFVVSLFLGWISFYASSAFSTDSGKRAETTEISATCETGMSGSRDFYRLPEEQDVRRQSLPTKQNTMMDTKKIGIAIIAPGGYVPDSSLEKGIDSLESRGSRVFNYYDPEKRYQRFSATDEERVQQIVQAVSNPRAQIVMALRGGYGTTRLLPYLDFDGLAKSGKLFVGHSDFTVFQMALLKKGGISFAGPMVNSDFAGKELGGFTIDHFEACMTSPEVFLEWFSRNNPDVNVEGVLWGGNLTMLAHLAGTPWMPDISGGILFVEDVHEQPYRVERMLLQLDEAGILGKQKALVLGHFTEFKETDYDNGYDFEAMLVWLRSRLTIPVLTGLPFGHVRDKATLPVGGHARLVSREGKTQLYLSGYPTVW